MRFGVGTYGHGTKERIIIRCTSCQRRIANSQGPYSISLGLIPGCYRIEPVGSVVQVIAARARIGGIDTVIAGGRLSYVLFHFFDGLSHPIELAAVDGVGGSAAHTVGCHMGDGPGLFRRTAAGTNAHRPCGIGPSKLVRSRVGGFSIGILDRKGGRAHRIPIIHLRTGAQSHTGLIAVFCSHKSPAAQGHTFVPIDFCAVPQNRTFDGIGFGRCTYSSSVFFIARDFSLITDGHAAIARTTAVLAQGQGIRAAGHRTGAKRSSPAGRSLGIRPDAHRSTAGCDVGISHGADMDGPFRRRSGIAADGHGIGIGSGTMADGYGVIILGAGILAQGYAAGAIGHGPGTDGRCPRVRGIGSIA